MKYFQFGKYKLPLDEPHIMGVLNITHDSFYDGGKWLDKHTALSHAEQMAEEGAAIIDIGGESTRPGSEAVDPNEEQDRVLSVVSELVQRLSLPISLDTSNPQLISEASAAGCSLINDVRALTREGALQAASTNNLPVCLMHMQGEPKTMQQNPHYKDVMSEVKEYLKKRTEQAISAGISSEQIILDPGFGFGKKFEHNRLLLQNLEQLHQLECPILVGLSRKSFFGEIIKRKAEERLSATIAATALAVNKGAWIIRVHDVKENLDALKLAIAIRQ